MCRYTDTDQPFSAPNPHIPDSRRWSSASDSGLPPTPQTHPPTPQTYASSGSSTAGHNRRRNDTITATTASHSAATRGEHGVDFAVPTQLSSDSGSLAEFRRWAEGSLTSSNTTQNDTSSKGSAGDPFVSPIPVRNSHHFAAAANTTSGRTIASACSVSKEAALRPDATSTTSTKATAGSAHLHTSGNELGGSAAPLTGPSLTSAFCMQQRSGSTGVGGSYASAGENVALVAGSISDTISTASTKATAGSAKTSTSTGNDFAAHPDTIASKTSPTDSRTRSFGSSATGDRDESSRAHQSPPLGLSNSIRVSLLLGSPFDSPEPADRGKGTGKQWGAPSSCQQLQRGQPITANMLPSGLRSKFQVQVCLHLQ